MFVGYKDWMGVTVQWRGEPGREPHTYGKTATFGNLRDKGSGYMSYSERIGPGVVVLVAQVDAVITSFADALMREGFTVLVPALDPGDEERSLRLAVAAIDHLLDNWHPRIGVVAFGGTVPIAEEIQGRRALDTVALFEGAGVVDIPVLAEDFAYDLS